MSDEPGYSDPNNSVDIQSCDLPMKKIKLTTTKNRSPRPISEKITVETHSNTWKFIDKNETMIAELSGGKLTLWQFLLELLMNDEYMGLIKWTDRNIGEFILIQAEEVAKLWGIRKDRNHRMNYDKLSRALRYYYKKNIIKKVHGHKFVYRFVSVVPDNIGGYCSSPTSPNNDLAESSQGELSPSNVKSTSTLNHETMQRTNDKNTIKNEFNSTLTALFQAALLSLSGTTPDSTSRIFQGQQDFVQSESNQHSDNKCSSNNSLRLEYKPDAHPLPTSAGIIFPNPNVTDSGLNIPPFDRQSILHFNRHSINMQRLSQELFLQSAPKSRFNHCILNPFSSTIDPSNYKLWLEHLAKNQLKSDHQPSNGDLPTVAESLTPPDNEINEDIIKPEKTTDLDHQSNLTTLFQRFVTEYVNKSPESSNLTGVSTRHNHSYSNSDIASLIKSQLSSQSSFVWMPVPIKYAEDIMNICLGSPSIG